jgi:C4-type Zn-finger protein
MRECPVCGEQGKLWNYWSGWDNEDGKIEPEESWCEYCGFKYAEGENLEEVIKSHLETLEYQVECGEEELEWWKNFMPKISRLEKVLAEKKGLTNDPR